MRRVTILLVTWSTFALLPATFLVTMHALLAHHSGGFHPGVDSAPATFGLALMVVLTAVAALPVGGLLLTARAWFSGHRRLRGFTALAQRTSAAGIEYWSIPGDRVSLFVAGALRPRIYATAGAERRLPAAAFHAALLHERAHQDRGDVAYQQLLFLGERSFGWLWPIRGWLRSLRFRSECLADRHALAAGADRLSLFDAITAAANVNLTTSASLTGGAALPRLEALAGSGRPVPGIGWRGPAGLAGLLLLPPILAHALIWSGVSCLPAL